LKNVEKFCLGGMRKHIAHREYVSPERALCEAYKSYCK